VLRSASHWSVGTEQNIEDSIYQAMLKSIQEAEHYIYIENQFFITSSTPEDSDSAEYISNKIGRALVERVKEAHKRGIPFRIYILLPLLPAFEGDITCEKTGNALRTILHFNYISICRDGNSIFKQIEACGINPNNYISVCSLRQKGELLGTPVTELIYIHSKLIIVDDKILICGSANINDRSLLGSRDSEVALYIEDEEFTEGVMNGSQVKCGKLVGALRKQLMNEHLGSHFDVQDCISDKFYKDIWFRTAAKNTKIFDEIFLCIPTDHVKTMEENKNYLSKIPLSQTDKFMAFEKLKEIQGYLVLLPLLYLESEHLTPNYFTKEFLAPTMMWT